MHCFIQCKVITPYICCGIHQSDDGGLRWVPLPSVLVEITNRSRGSLLRDSQPSEVINIVSDAATPEHKYGYHAANTN